MSQKLTLGELCETHNALAARAARFKRRLLTTEDTFRVLQNKRKVTLAALVKVRHEIDTFKV